MKWTRILGWIAVAIGALMIIIIVGVAVTLRTSWFHNYAIAKIEQEAHISIGSKVKVQNIDLHLLSLTADLYGITVRGSGNIVAKPLLQVEKLTVGLKIISLVHKEFNLSEVLIVHPVVNVVVNPQGENNLPRSTPSGNSPVNVFQFAIWHTAVSRGEICYNNKESKIDANLYDLRANISFDPNAKRYSGTLSYGSGKFQYDKYSPLPHSLDARFSATPSGATLQSAVLKLASSRLTLHANAVDYSNLRLNGSYDLLLHAQDFAAMVPGATARGDIFSSGSFQYQNLRNEPALQAASVAGDITSGSIQVKSPQATANLQNITGAFKLADGNLHVSDLSLALFGGRLVSDVSVQHLASTPATSIDAALQRISLADIRRAIRVSSLKQTRIAGTLDAKTHASWTGSIRKLEARAEIRMNGAVQSKSSSRPIPVNAAVRANYDGVHGTVSVQQGDINLPSLSLVAHGQISNRSNLQVQASSNNLHEVSVLATDLETISAPGKPAPSPVAVSGTATINALVQGSMKRPVITAQIGAQNLVVVASQWRSLSLKVKASPSQVLVQNASLVSASQGSVRFSGQVGLRNWGYSRANPIAATVSARQLSIAPLLELANQHYPVNGNLSVDVAVSGSELTPSGHGTVHITQGSVYDQPVQNLTAQLHGNGQSVTTALTLKTPAGSANANLTFAPKTRAYELSMKVPDLVLQKLQLVQARNTGIQGTLTMSASGHGTLDDPQLTAKLEIPQLKIQKQSLSSISADLSIAQHRAQATLKSTVLQSSIQAHANVDLTGNYYADAAIDTGNIPLQPVLAAYAPGLPPGFQGNTELHASLKGPLKDKAAIVAQVTVPTFSASYQSLQIATIEPLRVDYSNDVLTLQPVEFRGTDTNLRVQGRIPLANAGSMSVSAKGSIDLRLIEIFSPDVKSSGVIVLNVNSTGNLRTPSLNGQMRLQDASFSQTTVPLALQNGNGLFDINSNKIVISSLTGEVGGGTISASGSIAYRPAIQASITLHAESVALLYPTGVRTVLDSNLLFAGTAKASTLTGRVQLDSLSFTPAFDLTSLATQFNGVSVPSATPSFTDNIKLALAVQSSQNLSAYSSQISLQGSVNLQVIGTASNPVIVGRTDLTSGDLFFMNNRYVLQQGIISFINPNQTEPVLNVQVTTTIEQYSLTISLNGPIDKLNTSYTSQPPLATADIISLLYRGETTAQAAAAGTSADSMIASQVAGQFTSGISKLAGISSLQIDPLIGGSNTNPSARIALQQRVTKNLLFTFSTDVEQPQSEIVEGDYQINKRWSIGVIRDEVGGISVDARIHTNH